MQTKQNVLTKDEDAQVGIGTMIVFIATVLVAAVAAGVLIDMSGKLQERSSRTGSEATEQVASNFDVKRVVGMRLNATDAHLESLNITVALAPGASEVDLSQVKIQLQGVDTLSTLSHASTLSGTAFNSVEVRDADGSFTNTTSPVMTAGDLVTINIDLHRVLGGAVDPYIGVREEVQVSLIPETGSSAVIGFSTPPSFGTKTVIDLA